VLDLLGIPPPGHADGTSLLPLVRGEAEAPRVALIENMLFSEEQVGIRTAERKYIRWDSGKEEAYDLAADPAESRDLAALATEIAPLRALHTSFPQATRATPVARAGRLDVDAPDALRALGYVQ